MDVIVDRSRWLTGEACTILHVNSALRSTEPPAEGFQCCLGFVCEGLGAEKEEMAGLGIPQDIIRLRKEINKLGLSTNRAVDGVPPYDVPSPRCYELMHANDEEDTCFSRHAREESVIKHGAAIGIHFVFIGEYPDYEAIRERWERDS